MTPTRPHDGKLGIVTGGSRGIGAAAARQLAAKGCNLVLAYTSASSAGPVQAMCDQFASDHGIRALTVQADLLDPAPAAIKILAAAKELYAQLPRSAGQGGEKECVIDILINNAGVSSNQFLNDPAKGPIDTAEFDRVYKVNVLAPLLLTQTVAPYLPRDRSGRIVSVSSVSSSIGYEGQSVYAGTKAAVEAMTRCWSRELAGRATVNCINPGPAWGDMYAEAGDKFWRINQPYVDAAPLCEYDGEDSVLSQVEGGEEGKKRFDKIVREGMGSRRPGFTDEIAGTAIMLCEKEAGWTTGSVICANGGMKMSIA